MTFDPKAIDAFWAWWPEVRPRIESAINGGDWGELPGEISARIRAIHDHLAWEFGPGKRAPHHLALSSQGNLSLRPLTECWRMAAPLDEETWEFYGARQPIADLDATALRLGAVDFDLKEVRLDLDIDDARERIDVVVWHPRFSDLSKEARGIAGFLALDQCLGEDGVERWIGTVRCVEEEVEEASGLAELREEAEAMTRRATGKRHALVEAAAEDGRPVIALINSALKPLDHLFKDRHIQLTFAYESEREDGLPEVMEGEALDALEDELLERLGSSAAFVARETGLERRVLHLHAGEDASLDAALDSWLIEPREQSVVLEVREDPRWEALHRWLP